MPKLRSVSNSAGGPVAEAANVSESSSGREPAPADDITVARAVRETVEVIPGVSRVSAGRFARAATYGPGAAVEGVVFSRAAGMLDVELHLIARYSRALHLPKLADRVRQSVRRVVEPLTDEPIGQIDIAFDDLDVVADISPDAAAADEPVTIAQTAQRIEAGL